MSRPSTSFRLLGRNTTLYGIAGVIGRVVSVFMLPVYTHYLSPREYGILQLLDISVEITYILFSAGTRSGLQRFYFKATTDETRRQVVFTTYALELALSTLGTVALVALAVPVHRLVLVGEGTPALIRIAAMNFTLGAMAGVPLALLQIEQRATAFTVAQMGKLAIQVTLNVVFLAHYHFGVASMLWSTAIANVTVGLILGGYLLARTGMRFSRAVFRDLRRFGVPYQVTTAAAFILAFGDRFFLQRSHGAAEVGLYGLAYQFGFLLYQLSSSPFNRAWEPQRFQLVTHPKEERDAAYSRGFLYFNLLLVTVAMGICVFVRPTIAVLTSNPFHSAASLVPLIIAAYVVQSWGDVAKFGIDVSENTRLYTYASWIATVVVVILYATLIPPFGGYGAALATVLAFLVRFALTYRWSQAVFPVNYRWGHIVRLTIIGTLAVIASMAWQPTPLAAQFGEAALLTAGYAALTWVLVLNADERRAILGLLRARNFTAMFKGA